MASSNLRLEYLNSQLADREKKTQRVQDEIDATTDFFAKESLENRLNLLFNEISDLEESIQQEKNDFNDRLLQRKFDNLINKLKDIQWEEINRAYQNTLPQWSGKVKQNVSDIQEILSELDKLVQGNLKYSACDEFIAHLFNDTASLLLSNTVTEWAKEYRQGIEWLDIYNQIQESQDKRLENAQPAILITIARSDEASTQSQDNESYYQLNAWLIEDIETYQTKKTGYHALVANGSIDAIPFVLEELSGKITDLLDRFLREQRRICKDCINYAHIHVFLPLELMNLGVDAWLLERESRRLKYLGHDYLVFVRCANRYDGNYKRSPSWKNLWNRHQNLLQKLAIEVLVEGHDEDLDELLDVLDDAVKDSNLVGLWVKDAPSDIQELVNELLESGLPIAIWARSNLDEDAHRTQLQELLQACCLERLPSTIKDKRLETRKAKNTKENHIGHHLSLLWDDPNFYPPKSA